MQYCASREKIDLRHVHVKTRYSVVLLPAHSGSRVRCAPSRVTVHVRVSAAEAACPRFHSQCSFRIMTDDSNAELVRVFVFAARLAEARGVTVRPVRPTSPIGAWERAGTI